MSEDSDMSIPIGVPPRKRRVVKINPVDKDLGFSGTNFRRFLSRFELAAEVDGSKGYDMVRQSIGFIKVEDLKSDLEEMEGYEERDWDLLKLSMMERWGEALPLIRFTFQDLNNLSEDYIKKGGIKNYIEYRHYLSEFLGLY